MNVVNFPSSHRFTQILLTVFALFLIDCSFPDCGHSENPSRTQPDEKLPQPELVSFSRDGATLHGFIYKPEGKGPFPAVIYNHGSEKIPGWFPTLGEFWTSKGFVFFVPHRRGHGRSSGDYIVDLQTQFREKEKDLNVTRKYDIELHEKANLDVVAAIAWLKQQSFINTNALVMSGISYGGIQTVLSGKKDWA
ncbi:MAG: CocE/NonD family hydrolase [Verrucomicrobiota bacterium]